MNKKELENFEEELKNNGYRKYSSPFGEEAYGWFKTIYEDEEIRKYMIEFRVWDFSKYEFKDKSLKENPYSIDTVILDGDTNKRIDLIISHPKVSILEAEDIAEKLHEILKPYEYPREI